MCFVSAAIATAQTQAPSTIAVQNKQLLISVSDDEFRSSEDEDPTAATHSSTEEDQPDLALNASSDLAVIRELSDNENGEFSDENGDVALNIKNLDENLTKMVQKYQKPSGELSSGAAEGGIPHSPRAGVSTPSTVIDRQLTPVSTPRQHDASSCA